MAQLPTRSLRLRSYTTTDLDRLTGEKGEIFYDYEKRTLKVYNGAGVAASTVTVGPADRLVNGSRSLLLAANGALTISGDIRSEGDINIEINLADSTLQRWSFGEDGSLTFPDGTTQATAYTGGTVFTNLIDSADSSAITVTPAVIFSSDVTVENELKIKTLVNDQSKWRFGTDGIITLPNSMTIDGSGTGGESVLIGGTSTQIIVSNDGAPPGFYVRTNFNVDPKIWLFGPDGSTTFPAGGTITEGGGISGAIRLTPSGGANEYQALLIYPTAGEGDHIHLTAGGGTTELYLGNDLHYVKLANDGFVIIQADNGVNGAVWGFAPDGTTSIPGDIKSDSNINIEINLSDSTKRIWQFGEDGQLTFPDGGNLRVSAVPATSIGAAGDTAGMLAFNASYAYYCTANYDGVTNIWRRTAHDVATW